jgi:hypothetical protein
VALPDRRAAGRDLPARGLGARRARGRARPSRTRARRTSSAWTAATSC